MVMPLYLNAATVRTCLSDDEIFTVVGQTMRAMATDGVVSGPTAEFSVTQNGVRNRMGSMSGCVASESAAGLKWFFVPGREGPRDLPRVPATILVSNAESGMLDGVLDATFLTCERTAAMGVIAATACARRPLRNAVIVGAGHVGRAAAKFMSGHKDIRLVTLASRTETGAREACEQVGQALNHSVALRATANVREAVRDADVVITATSVAADADVVCAAWLKEDAIVCSLGSCREVDLALVASAWMVAHDIEHRRKRRVDLKEGGVGWSRVAGDVASLMAGRLPLPEDTVRIYLMVGAIGALDLALGARALANARRQGIGVPLA